MLDNLSRQNLSSAALLTVVYADIFDYPLTAVEVHRYLTGVNASLDEVIRALEGEGLFTRTGNYFTLSGREEIVPLRLQREKRALALLPRALKYGRALGSLPFVRMVALTGSLAVKNVSETADFDYLLITQPGRLWMARAFAVTFGRIVRPLGHTLCVNLLLSENALAWPYHDIYSAREICQMIPITGMNVYHRLRAANAWTESILPNSTLSAPNLEQISVHDQTNRVQRLLELPLRGPLGARLEGWAMDFQLSRIARRWGRGEETQFSADVCQSNFHDHRQRTREVFQNKLTALGIEKDATASSKMTVTSLNL